MNVSALVESLDFGISAAEHEKDLANYFLETPVFLQVIKQSADIIVGDKGTGKSAIYRMLKDKSRNYPRLGNVRIVDGFNPSGESVFRRFSSRDIFEEEDYRNLWKYYIFVLAGLRVIKDYPTGEAELHEIKEALKRLGALEKGFSLESIVGFIFSKIPQISKVEGGGGLEAIGLNASGRLEFFEKEQNISNAGPTENLISSYLQMVNDLLKRRSIEIWVAFDRLDESFHENPEMEKLALRALFRTYLDFCDHFENIKLKLFVRRDLFERITEKNFVNLSHIKAKTQRIIWSEDDLWSMLSKRVMRSKEVAALCGEDVTTDNLLRLLLPKKIDSGERKPSTRNWILSRIRDGNHVLPPRSLIDLFRHATTEQLKRDKRDASSQGRGLPILESVSFKEAFSVLSEDRVQDTLYAEASHLRGVIESFRGGKAEHDDATLAKIINRTGESLEQTKNDLKKIGFLEPVGAKYKIPFVYRSYLEIKQGKSR